MLVMAKATGGGMNNGFELEVPGEVLPQKLPVTLSTTCCGVAMKTLCAVKVRENTY